MEGRAVLGVFCALVVVASAIDSPIGSKVIEAVSLGASVASQKIKDAGVRLLTIPKTGHKITWIDSIKYCENKGFRLCTSKQYCPHGEGKPPRSDVQPHQTWAPTSDQKNEWVHLSSGKHLCQTHTQSYDSRPYWGLEKESKDFRGQVACCGEVYSSAGKDGATWQEASAVCEAQGKRLCMRNEYCPDGPGTHPEHGVVDKSAWSAVFDRKGDFVTVGSMFPKTLLCKKFSEIVKGKIPTWGASAAPTPFRGWFMCCDDEFERLPNGATWADAKKVCKKNGKRLCKAREICANGEGHPPKGFGRMENSFAAVGDKEGQWVNVGRDEGEMCKLSDRTKEWAPSQGWVQCCLSPLGDLEKELGGGLGGTGLGDSDVPTGPGKVTEQQWGEAKKESEKEIPVAEGEEGQKQAVVQQHRQKMKAEKQEFKDDVMALRKKQQDRLKVIFQKAMSEAEKLKAQASQTAAKIIVDEKRRQGIPTTPAEFAAEREAQERLKHPIFPPLFPKVEPIPPINSNNAAEVHNKMLDHEAGWDHSHAATTILDDPAQKTIEKIATLSKCKVVDPIDNVMGDRDAFNAAHANDDTEPGVPNCD